MGHDLLAVWSMLLRVPIIAILLGDARSIDASFATVISKGSDCERLIDQQFRHELSEGRFSVARSLAASIVASNPACEKLLAQLYQKKSNDLLKGEGYLAILDSIFEGAHESSSEIATLSSNDSVPCWNADSSDVSKTWDTCCSALSTLNHHHDHTKSSSLVSFSTGSNEVNIINNNAMVNCQHPTSELPLCCDFFAGSPTHLRLPALREVSLNIRISIPKVNPQYPSKSLVSEQNVSIKLEQEGFLRPYDIASILWPAGYLLSLCVASPLRCGMKELHQAIDYALTDGRRDYIAIELGAGVGGPSVALSLYIQSMLLDAVGEVDGNISKSSHNSSLLVATDSVRHSLALIATNSRRNHASVMPKLIDYTDEAALLRLKNHIGRGFAVVLGSSLQSFFYGTEDPTSLLWSALDILLDDIGTNPNAVALFAHTRSEPIEPPSDGRYKLLRRISGDVFAMHTRSGDSSDFVISAFQRGEIANEKDLNIQEEL